MAKIEEVQQFLQQLAPAGLAAPWDNVGVLVDCAADVTSILVSLDITDEVVAEAEIQGCQLIVAHHPVIFKPMSRIGRGDVPFRMIKKNISALCAHTNLDAAEGGVNDILCKLFGVGSARPFGEGDLGRVGQVRTTGAAQLAAQCKATLNAPSVKLVDTGRPISTLAVVGGSGGDMLAAAAAAGADALLTGEAKHHDALEAKRLGVSLIAAGHYSTEFPIVPVLADKLAKRFNGVRVLCSRRNKEPFTYL
ncbi:Nif3-like dinuclear metal center hexameric protein [Allofournierella sp.]|uniref:Nif3-like dinuclear metal center hexameric protein n=1 Tax=Allofournierella sp. TaxID=1940256 RepID=UPI003AB37121